MIRLIIRAFWEYIVVLREAVGLQILRIFKYFKRDGEGEGDE